MKPSPLPWSAYVTPTSAGMIDAEAKCVLRFQFRKDRECDANRALVERAVNHHEELVAAATAAAQWLERYVDNGFEVDPRKDDFSVEILAQIEGVLAKVRA
ncbi:MAG: hypothetical protein ACK52I_29285 [Pseudomonadota bacterium]